jgi:hypothetical protein
VFTLLRALLCHGPRPRAVWDIAEVARIGRSGVAAGVLECPHCRTSFVCPVGWCPEGAGDQIRILLRCGQCEAWRRVTVSVEVAERLNRDFEHARSLMSTTAAGLERRRIAAERGR